MHQKLGVGCSYIPSKLPSYNMSLYSGLREAEKLLHKVDSWSEEEIEELPKFYRDKAREYQGLLQRGEE